MKQPTQQEKQELIRGIEGSSQDALSPGPRETMLAILQKDLGSAPAEDFKMSSLAAELFLKKVPKPTDEQRDKAEEKLRQHVVAINKFLRVFNAGRSLGELIAEIGSTSGSARTGYMPRYYYKAPDYPECSAMDGVRTAWYLPAEEAKKFAGEFNGLDRHIVGSVIETHAHPTLESGVSLPETGWPPRKIHLELLNDPFDASSVLADPVLADAFASAETKRKERGKRSVLQEENWTKYSVVDAPAPLLESVDLNVVLRPTKRNTIMRCLPGLIESPDLRRKYGHIRPASSQVPHSLGLHFVALLSDGNMLAIRRGADVDYWPGAWSFSGEEQLFPVDLEWPKEDRMKYYMLRTAVEEIFPLATDSNAERLMKRIQMVEPKIYSMRVWSLLLEEPILNYSFFAVYELALTTPKYKEFVRGLVSRQWGQMSREGDYFVVALKDLPDLLDGQDIKAEPLFGDKSKPSVVSSRNLHPTSRYRACRLLEALARAGRQQKHAG